MSNPTGLCKCGCGQKTSLADKTNRTRGHAKGEHVDFIRGHSSFRTPVELRNAPLPLCMCGCGVCVMTRGSRVLRGHHMKLVAPNFKTEDRGFETPCEIWQGTIDRVGYGRFERRDEGVNPTGTVLVHRQVWIAAHGVPPAGMDVHHRCEQKDCGNIDHLQLRSKAEHLRAHRGISPEKYAEIVAALRTSDESQAGIARRFGVSKVFIWKLKKDLG